MIRKMYLYSIGLVILVILASFSGLVLIQNLNKKSIGLKELQPHLIQPDKPITQIIVINGSQYTNGLEFTLRNLQALVNTHCPNGTLLYIVDDSQDLTILNEVYANLPGLTISQLNFSNNSHSNVASLINYFKFLVKGFVFFNSTDKLFYPAVLNFVSNYENVLAIPYPDYSLLPANYQYLEMYNFINKTDSSTTQAISEYYVKQIHSFSTTLHGTNLWNYTNDKENYFDFVIDQKYFSFPAQLLNGSFPVVESKIKAMTNNFYNKAILNTWPTNTTRLNVPLYSDIHSISDLSVYSVSISSQLQTKQTFQEIFKQNYQHYQTLINNAPNTTYSYSLLINTDHNDIQFILDTVIPILSVDPTFFDTMTIVINDATFMLLPELYYWVFAQHPEIHFMPKITIGSTIQSIYFPENFLNETGFIQQDTTQILRNDWTSQKYLQLLQHQFLGFYINDKEKYSDVFTVKVASPTITLTSADNTTEPSMITHILASSQSSVNKSFVIVLTGENQFLIDTIQSFSLALQHIESTSTNLFMGLPPNLLFNKIA